MTQGECGDLIRSYLDWLRKGLSAAQIGDSCELTTPFLNHHNDHLQIYATRKNGTIVLTDDGATLADLNMSGVNIGGPRRQAVLATILNGVGVRRVEDQLQVEASAKNLGQRVHQLVQAMLSVNDMFVLAQPRVESLFLEDVSAFLDAHEIRYSPMVKLTGKTGFDHAIDFLIPRSRQRPERILQAINVPTKTTVSNYLFVLEDTRSGREESKAEAYAFLNDQERDIGGDVVEALHAYSVEPIPWSRREEKVAALSN